MDALIDFLNTKYGIEPSTTLSVLVTLFVFISGIVLSESTKIISRYLLRKNTRQLFKQSCGIIVKSLEKQSRAFNDISLSFNFDDISLLSYERVELTGAYLLEDLGYERAFKSLMVGIENRVTFSKKLRTKAVAKVWSISRAVRYIHERAYKDIDLFLSEYNARNEKRNGNLDLLRKTIFSLQASLNGKQVPEEVARYLKELEHIFSEWVELEDKTRPDIVHKNLVLKLYELDQKERNDFLSIKLNPLILNVMADYTNQKKYLENASLQFKYYSRIMSQNARFIRLLMPILMMKFAFRKRSIFSS